MGLKNGCCKKDFPGQSEQLFICICLLNSVKRLCARMGGEPWAIADLPYLTKLTQVIGVEVTESQVSIVASLNQ